MTNLRTSVFRDVMTLNSLLTVPPASQDDKTVLMPLGRRSNLKCNLINQRKTSEVWFKQFSASCEGADQFVHVDELKNVLSAVGNKVLSVSQLS